jgi:6-phosphogluconolactonase (cycloisomerase 2 family)
MFTRLARLATILTALMVFPQVSGAGGTTAGGVPELSAVPGSPFSWSTSGIHTGSLEVIPDDTGLLMPEFYTGSHVSALAVAPTGEVSLVGVFSALSGFPNSTGMASSPSGRFVYFGTRGEAGAFARAVDGSLTFLQRTSIAGNMGSCPVNYLVYASLADGDYVFADGYGGDPGDGLNHVGAARVEADGTLTPLGTISSGEVFLPQGRCAPASHVIAFAAGRVFAANPSSVAVFDVGAGGSLTPVAGSPFPMPGDAFTTTALAAAPDGTALFVAREPGEIARYAVNPSGALQLAATYLTSSGTLGLTVHPTGRWVAATAYLEKTLLVLDATTLLPVPGSPFDVAGAAAVPMNCGFGPAGDRLFVGHSAVDWTIVSAFRFAVPPAVSCVGTPAAPARLATAPSHCSTTVDAQSALAGGCLDAGGGLASCTFDGLTSLSLGPGSHQVAVVGTAPGGASAACTSYVEVLDQEPPSLGISASPDVLWPPNGVLVKIDLAVKDWDNCTAPLPAVTCEAISSEPHFGRTPDVVWKRGQLFLRAERNGLLRVYTITCVVRDAAGLTAKASDRVVVAERRPQP